MTTPDCGKIATRLENSYGLSLAVRSRPGEDGMIVELVPKQFEGAEGFSIVCEFGWRSYECKVVPGKYGGETVALMGDAGAEARGVAKSLLDSLEEHGSEVRLEINGRRFSLSQFLSEPQDRWRQLSLAVRKRNLAVDDLTAHDVEALVESSGGCLLGAVIALLGVEEYAAAGEQVSSGLPEGALSRIEVNRYERSAVNRAACIAERGCRCVVCGLDFGLAYGDVADGFIHVHHLTPVSEMGDGYVIDPIHDLVPVCPNCHAVMHRRDPPYSPEEVRGLLRRQTTG